jgi:hypothetical protein
MSVVHACACVMCVTRVYSFVFGDNGSSVFLAPGAFRISFSFATFIVHEPFGFWNLLSRR